jgi:pimeloyl-ACP methyl ester carboxylesterase
MRSESEEQGNDFFDGIIEIRGKQIHAKYREMDPFNPTLVFLHDSLGCIQLWRDFPYQLAKGLACNILIYDRWGYGKSEAMTSFERPKNYLELEADFLDALLLKLNINKAILLGHSDGASIALIAVSKYPAKIMAVISEAAHVFVEECTLAGIYEIIEDYKTTNLKERLARYHGNKVEVLFKAWTETWTDAKYSDWNIEHLLPAISCPVLIIQGEEDEYGTLRQADAIFKPLGSKAEKLIVPNCGHTPHKDHPALLQDKIKIFISNLY